MALQMNEKALSEGEIHVWSANLDIQKEVSDIYWSVLSVDEKERANRFRFVKDKTHYIAARGILRHLLGQYLNENPKRLQFQYSDYQKPFLEHQSEMEFNVSHSGSYGLFVFTIKNSIGIDIEYTQRPIEVAAVASRFFSKKEAEKLLALPISTHQEAFYNCWTRKEAIIKAIGQGLSFPLDQFEVTLAPNSEAELLATYWDEAEVGQWEMRSFVPAPNYIGALAIRTKIESIQYFKWEE